MLHLLSGLLTDLPTVLFWAPPGWNSFVNLLEEALDFLARTFHSAGLAVVAFTIIIKTILLPLTVQSIRSSKAMQELQPKIKELQKKYGKDRQRLSQETMRLYSEHRVNPMSGCLPMLLQIPIFFGLYRAIVHLSGGNGADGASQYWDQGFLWLSSLDDPDPYKILPILAGVFQFVQTKMMRPSGQGPVTDPQQRMMNQMMNFMPLMVVVFGWNFASGPVIYWATQSIYSVIQQWFITGWGSLNDWIPGLPELPEHRRLGYRPPKPVEDVVVVSGEGGAPARQGGVMGWMQRQVEKSQQQQQARQATRAGHRSAAATAATAGAAEPEPEAEIEVEDEEAVETRPRRSGRTTSYQARVEAAKHKPSRAKPVEAVAEPAGRASGGSKAARRGTQRAARAAQPANGDQPNGVERAPAVPRKTRPPRKSR